MPSEFVYSREWDSKQLDVINLGIGEHLVLAPPGCGKTEILTERLRYALHLGVSPQQMICLTFTNRASREMRNRIAGRGDSEAATVFVGNLHKFCSELLYSKKLVNAGAIVLDEYDLQDILRDYLSDNELQKILEVKCEFNDNYKLNWYILHHYFLLEDKHPLPSNKSQTVKGSRLRGIYDSCRMVVAEFLEQMYQVAKGHPVELLQGPDFTKWGYSRDVLLKIFSRPDRINDRSVIGKIMLAAFALGEYKKSHNLLTFNDLILQTYTHYLCDRESLTLPHYSWIQVDEVQDLNPLQLSLIDLLKAPGEITAVYLGDEQQAIFSFMGAKLETLKELRSKCSNLLRLEKNFRSPRYIVDLLNDYATSVLQTPRAFLPIANNDDMGAPNDKMIFGFQSHDEPASVTRRTLPYFERLANQDDTAHPESAPHRTAILVPTNRLADLVSDELNTLRKPHFKISGTDIFSSDEIKTLLAHFSVCTFEFNVIAWARIIWMLSCGNAESTIADLSTARHIVKQMVDSYVTPSDLLRTDGSTALSTFCDAYRSPNPIVVFDTETTGLDTFNDDIVQIAAFKVIGGKIVEELNLILRTDRKIPAMLGDLENPLVEEYARAEKLDRADGLRRFLDFAEGCALVAHNASYDYRILDANLRRDCGITDLAERHPVVIDTLKLAHILHPRLRMYRLKFLAEALELEGENTHLADDDSRLTVNLMNHFYAEATDKLALQSEFFERYGAQLRTFTTRYAPIYEHTRTLLTEPEPMLSGGYSHILPEEMLYVLQSMDLDRRTTEMHKIEKVLKYIDKEVIDADCPRPLLSQLEQYLSSLSSYKESDMCGGKVFDDRIIVSTVHKAKGLEFQNVIVMGAVNGLYPFVNSRTAERRLEDARKFYVALSRAKRRLCITHCCVTEWQSFVELTPFLNEVEHHFKAYTDNPGKASEA